MALLAFVGSVVAVAGAGCHVPPIVVARSLLTMQLMNVTATAFVAGAVLFTSASFPCLETWRDSADTEVIFAFVAAPFPVGSALVAASRLTTGRRARTVARATRRGSAGDGGG